MAKREEDMTAGVEIHHRSLTQSVTFREISGSVENRRETQSTLSNTISPVASEPLLLEGVPDLGLPVPLGNNSDICESHEKQSNRMNRKVGIYQALEKIGHGRFGEVWRAIDEKTNQIVALKLLYMEKESEGVPAPPLREMSMLTSLAHENIVNLKEVLSVSEEHSNSVYIVLEFMDYNILKLHDFYDFRFSISQCKNIIRQVLCGIAYCHSQNVLHRDIKISNVFVDDEGLVKIANFGRARGLGNITKDCTIISDSLWYRSPELLLGETDYGTEIDIWSAGCLIAELITGAPLVSGQTTVDQLEKVCEMVGSPNGTLWDRWCRLPLAEGFRVGTYHPLLKSHIMKSAGVTEKCVSFVQSLLTMNPANRPRAADALEHEWFSEEPLACKNWDLLSMLRKENSSESQDEL